MCVCVCVCVCVCTGHLSSYRFTQQVSPEDIEVFVVKSAFSSIFLFPVLQGRKCAVMDYRGYVTLGK